MFAPTKRSIEHLPPFILVSGTKNVPPHLEHLLEAMQPNDHTGTITTDAGPQRGSSPAASPPLALPNPQPAMTVEPITHGWVEGLVKLSMKSVNILFGIYFVDLFDPESVTQSSPRRRRSTLRGLDFSTGIPERLQDLLTTALETNPPMNRSPLHYINSYIDALHVIARKGPHSAEQVSTVVRKHRAGMENILWEMRRKLKIYKSLGETMKPDAERLEGVMKNGRAAILRERLQEVTKYAKWMC